MAEQLYDFSGYVTRNNLMCSDGRTILPDAFAHQDGSQVPLVWQHDRDNMSDVVGHVKLENRSDGVYGYGSLNNTELGNTAKELIRHRDITDMSIYANQLRQVPTGPKTSYVTHGQIREVSLVIAGSNPGAVIDVPYIEHSDGSTEQVSNEAIIYTPNDFCIELYHTDGIENGTNKKNKKGETMSTKPNEQDKETKPDEIDVQKVLDSFTEEQKIVIGMLLDADEGDSNEEDEKEVKTPKESGDKTTEEKDEEKEMKHNAFDKDSKTENYLRPAEQLELEHSIIADGKRYGSLRDAYIAYEEDGRLEHSDLEHSVTNADGTTQAYGMANVNYLFPEAKSITPTPGFVQRKNDWVATVMEKTHNTPFSRIKSVFADITMDEARAKGYVKGKLKKDEVFSLLKRTTDPQTVYKKQKMDRDDIVDITDFDVVAWLKGEMRLMLDEEIARAILVGDGRLNSDDDHISEDHIRPIAKDDELYAIKVKVEPATGATDEDKAKEFIRAAIKSRKDYRGSGNPILFTTEDQLANMLLIEDNMGHLMYQNETALATTMRVSEIVTVPVMESAKDNDGNAVTGIIVNLADYNVGADKGGAVSMFDDFDIDYNQQKYLIETRVSGALTVPKSAIVFTETKAADGGTGV